MAYKLKTNLANKNNYGSKRSKESIKWIVIHYTGNDGDSDEANGNYFKNNIVKASAHWFIDDDSVTQSVPEDYVAYSVGGSRYSNYKQTGGATYYEQARNANTLNIELCDSNKDGKVEATEKTLDNTVDFVKKKMKEYNIDIDHVIRHFDVTGKSCPVYFCGSDSKDKEWEEFKARLKETKGNADKKNTSSTKNESYKVKVTASVLNVRDGAGTGYKVNTQVKQGEVYTIVEEKNGWGKLKSGAGWIYLSYVKRI